jgi:hypothetical protein
MGELYYLRLLLHDIHSLGAKSFFDLKTIASEEPLSTYREVCLGLGILQDDGEWREAMEEATLTQMPRTIRQLFCTILEWCNPSDPRTLFEGFKDDMAEDYERMYGNRTEFSREIKDAMVILDIKRRLDERNITLKDCGLPDISDEVHKICESLDNELSIAYLSPLLREQTCYNCEEESAAFRTDYDKLEGEQKVFVDRVISCIESKTGQTFFLDAIAGAGKTFCENILLSYCRAHKKVALGVATSGMASILLKKGRTAQSRFHLPIITRENCTWDVSAQSQDAELFRETDLIIWDEVSMAHRHLIEALDTGLRDIKNNDTPFAAKVIVFAGDFRQILPIVKHGSRAQIVNACLKRSRIWHQNIETHHFLINRRLRLHGIDTNSEDYAQWLLTIGNGTAPTTSNETYDDLIDIPEHILLEGTKEDLAEWVFPNLEKHYLDAKWMCERAILTPKNNAVNDINDLMMDRFPSIDSEVLAESADKLNDEYEAAGIPNEYLNTLNPPGFPPHHLRLKIRMPLMLLRNLDPSQGLCNGTKLSLKHIYNHTIEVEILGGQHNGKAVCIPCILLKPKEGEYPFDWERCQFPVNVAFAMTINKSQGQTLTRVGIYLPEPVFAHGQLYTGSSRPSHPNNIRVTVIPSVDSQPTNKTRNIVYTEVIEDTT